MRFGWKTESRTPWPPGWVIRPRRIPETRSRGPRFVSARAFPAGSAAPAALLQSIEIYRQALARDPRDPECNAALASAEIYLANLGQIPPEEADRVARPLIQRSLDADPSSGETHLMLAGLLYLNDHNWPAAEVEFKKAVELGPNSPSIRNNYGYFLMYRGRFDEAAVQFAKGKEIDPLNVMPHFNMGSLYAVKRDYPRAETEFRKVIETSPKNFAARIWLADVLTFEKKYDAAYQELDRARALMVTPDMATVIRAIFLARQGKQGEARDILAKLPAAAGSYFQRAIAYMELGIGIKLFDVWSRLSSRTTGTSFCCR